MKPIRIKVTRGERVKSVNRGAADRLGLTDAERAWPADLTPALARASERIRATIAAEPLMLAGTGRFDTRMAPTFGEDVLSKCGAEGVAAAVIPLQGIGLAIKIDDGAGRAAEAAMVALLRRVLPGPLADHAELRNVADSPLRNWKGITVGRLRAC